MVDVVAGVWERLLALSPAAGQELEGASEEEIRELEAYAGGSLPAVYKQFLRRLGRSAGELFRGSDYSLSQRFRLRLREYAEELLRRENAPFTLPPTAFVFLMTQGYQFAFFHIDRGDAPSVYHYVEGEDAPRPLDPSLSGYLLRCIEACERREQRQC